MLDGCLLGNRINTTIRYLMPSYRKCSVKQLCCFNGEDISYPEDNKPIKNVTSHLHAIMYRSFSVPLLRVVVDRHIAVGIATRYAGGRSGDRIPVEV